VLMSCSMAPSAQSILAFLILHIECIILQLRSAGVILLEIGAHPLTCDKFGR
jgi:hypothetical protein